VVVAWNPSFSVLYSQISASPASDGAFDGEMLALMILEANINEDGVSAHVLHICCMPYRLMKLALNPSLS